MANYLGETKSGVVCLQNGESFELRFAIPNDGDIHLVVAAVELGTLIPCAGVCRRLELYRPGTSQPVVVNVDGGRSFATILSHRVALMESQHNGDWCLRVTNLDERFSEFRIYARVPTRTPVALVQAPSFLVEQLTRGLLGEISVRLTRGEKSSYVQFPEALQLAPQRFSIPEFRTGLKLLLVRFLMTEFVKEISSSGVAVSLGETDSTHPNGFLRLEFKFQGPGRELGGSFQIDLSEVQLSVDLDLDVDDNRLTYSNVRTRCDLRVNVASVPDFALNAIFNYEEAIEAVVARQMMAIFDDAEVRSAISRFLAGVTAPITGASFGLSGVTVREGSLLLHAFPLAQSRAA